MSQLLLLALLLAAAPPERYPVRRLTVSAAREAQPFWSPDGARISFVSNRTGAWQVWGMGADGAGARALTDLSEPVVVPGELFDFRPSMSPDGGKLLFDRYESSHDLYVRDLETGVERRITDHPGYDSDGRWSPDGAEIVFQSDRDGHEPYDTRIFVVRADGTGLRLLTPRPEKSSYPAWSPDGTSILFATDRFGGSFELAILDLR